MAEGLAKGVHEMYLCDEPVAFDAATPEPPHDYEWHDVRDKDILVSHLRYYEDMVIYLSWLLQDGPETDKEIPTKPKGSIQAVLGKAKPTTKLSGEELHNYLEKHIANNSDDLLEVKWSPTNLESVKDTLVHGFKTLKRLNANLLAHYMDYGYFLNKAFDYFSFCKDNGNIAKGTTFQHWLSDNVGISAAYARKLRLIARDFHDYKNLRKLGISFSEFWQRKEQIRIMLSVYPELSTFWKGC